jgi:hypothetical protein
MTGAIYLLDFADSQRDFYKGGRQSRPPQRIRGCAHHATDRSGCGSRPKWLARRQSFSARENSPLRRCISALL